MFLNLEVHKRRIKTVHNESDLTAIIAERNSAMLLLQQKARQAKRGKNQLAE